MEHPEMDMYAYERFLADGKTPFCGVDEAGPAGRAGVRCGGPSAGGARDPGA